MKMQMRMGVEGSRGATRGYGVTSTDCTMPHACLVGHCSVLCCCICTQESQNQHVEVSPLPEELTILLTAFVCIQYMMLWAVQLVATHITQTSWLKAQVNVMRNIFLVIVLVINQQSAQTRA